MVGRRKSSLRRGLASSGLGEPRRAAFLLLLKTRKRRGRAGINREVIGQVIHAHRCRVTAARLLAECQYGPDAMLAHVAEAHGRDLVAVRLVGPARVAGRASHPLGYSVEPLRAFSALTSSRSIVRAVISGGLPLTCVVFSP